MTHPEAKHQSLVYGQPKRMPCHYYFSLHRFVRESQVSIKKTLSDNLRSIAILARFLLISKSSLAIEPNHAHDNVRDSHV